jgi:hypothetical protein
MVSVAASRRVVITHDIKNHSHSRHVGAQLASSVVRKTQASPCKRGAMCNIRKAMPSTILVADDSPQIRHCSRTTDAASRSCHECFSCQSSTYLSRHNCLLTVQTFVFCRLGFACVGVSHLAAAIVTYTAPVTLNASTPASILAMGITPGDGIEPPSWW